MAGRKAQQIVATSTRDLKAVAGLAGGDEKVFLLISGAEEYAKKAAESGRNPPYTSDRWSETALMWEKAIRQLEKIPSDNLEVQSRLADYQKNLGEVNVRLKKEQEAVQALDRANQKLKILWASLPLPKERKDFNPNQAMGSLIDINNDLDKIAKGTTVYVKAQEIKMQVQEQLKLLKQAK